MRKRARSAIFTGSPMTGTATAGPLRARSCGAEDSLHRGFHGEEVTLDVGVGNGNRASTCDLFQKQRYDATFRPEDVAEANGRHAGGRIGHGLQHHLSQSLGGSHDAARVHRFVGGDHDEPLASVRCGRSSRPPTCQRCCSARRQTGSSLRAARV